MGAGEAIEIGAVRPEELDTMLGIMCESFGLPFDAAREVFYDDPYFAIENKRVLRVNGQIASCLTIVEAACWLGFGVARLGGIAGVATAPALRRRGYAGCLLAATLRTLDERGYALSALFPFAYDYYRKFGWELAGFAHRYLTAPANLFAYPEARYVRLARPEDIPHLQRLYDAASRGQTLRCLRDARRWQYILDHIKQRVVYSPDKSTVEGYLLYEFRPGTLGGEEGMVGGMPLPLSLRVLEMCVGTPAARRGLVGHLAAQTRVGCIEYASTWEDLADGGLLQPGIASGKDSLASVDIVPSVMTRVINLGRALEALRPNWAGFHGTLALVMHDPLSASGTAAALIVGTGSGKPQVREVEAAALSARPDRVEGEVGAWSQVIVGRLSGEDACALGLLRASTPRALERMARLFPRRTPFLPAPDHF
ncbi:MAG TPA: GNAT family N-acetyltransferase [Chthonomonadaceae bacterium]|nr:GNAT family N-acetyltransferase [Chthonomonadaceae bacterium]